MLYVCGLGGNLKGIKMQDMIFCNNLPLEVMSSLKYMGFILFHAFLYFSMYARLNSRIFLALEQ